MMGRIKQGDIPFFGGATRWHPLCSICGRPEREPHKHADEAALAVLLAEVRRLPFAHSSPREYLDVKQLADYGGWSPRTLLGWARDPVDPLPSFSNGGKMMFGRRAYDEWFARRASRREAPVGGIVRDVLDELRGGR